ncbi:hypothetical protein F9K91_05065 [Brucella tritici]|uniref:Uncharacterized protein n=1 Tax=Brucella tritici TaxID=94626 RepID=A0A7X6FR09_9HYPH|nr:hypothetical protein [Brucella tritici]KAB2666554.1 hypothetical protein F9K91_05065 [Brucella tritici]NKW09445.1 hypothetical protein [Brucella tritici]
MTAAPIRYLLSTPSFARNDAEVDFKLRPAPRRRGDKSQWVDGDGIKVRLVSRAANLRGLKQGAEIYVGYGYEHWPLSERIDASILIRMRNFNELAFQNSRI